MNNIDKKTLEDLIDFHEMQIAANQRRIDELRGHFEPEPLPEVKPMFGRALKLEDAKANLSYSGDVIVIDHAQNHEVLNCGEFFVSEEAAELEAEKRRLRQLARVRMAESWGNERPNWDNKDQVKHCVCVGYPVQNCDNFESIHFRTEEHAEAFLKEVGHDGIRKILEL